MLVACVFRVFVWVGATASLRAATFEAKIPGLQAGALARRAVPTRGPESLALAEQRHDAGAGGAIVVVDDDGRPTGVVDATAAAATPADRRPWVTVGALATPLPAAAVSAALSGEDLVAALRGAAPRPCSSTTAPGRSTACCSSPMWSRRWPERPLSPAWVCATCGRLRRVYRARATKVAQTRRRRRVVVGSWRACNRSFVCVRPGGFCPGAATWTPLCRRRPTPTCGCRRRRRGSPCAARTSGAGALSPSRAGDFTTCPCSTATGQSIGCRAALGADGARNAGASVLEQLFDLPAPQRTMQRAVGLLPDSWGRSPPTPRDAAAAGTEGDPKPTDVAAWLLTAEPLLATYFTMGGSDGAGTGASRAARRVRAA